MFLDPDRIEEFSRHDGGGEDRYRVIGRTPADEILFIAYTWRIVDDEKICRLISPEKLVRRSGKDIEAYVNSSQFKTDAAMNAVLRAVMINERSSGAK